MIDAKLLSEVDGVLTMVNNGTRSCVVTLLNPFRNRQFYLDDFWTDTVVHPIEVYDGNELILNFTKFSSVDQFFLKNNFYKIIVPVGASFTVTGHENKVK